MQWSLKRAADPEQRHLGLPPRLDRRTSTTEGDKTVILKLKNPDPAILPALTVFNTAILPKKAFEAAAGATDEEKAKASRRHPISSGPFVLRIAGSAARR